MKKQREIKSWDAAIAHAQERIKDMKQSIKIWKRLRDLGEKWHTDDDQEK